MREKIKRFKDNLADRIKIAFLAFFNAIGTVWNILFVKTSDTIKSDSNEIRQGMIKNFFLAKTNYSRG